ncbi:uncharacterized protein [Watersipora subatra]|uniref:uncharacterized protein n=1 Tax=Watersipora subatra TaxID=2589382 RepID=UPI00355BA7B6
MYSDVAIPSGNLAEYVMRDWSKFGDKIALKSSETGQTQSFNQLNDYVHRLASSLTKMGIQKGDVVFLLSPNLPEYATIYLATVLIGAIVTTNNPAYTPSEVSKAIALSGAKLVFASPDNLTTVAQALHLLEGKHRVQETIVIGEMVGYRPLSSLLSGEEYQRDLLDLDYTSHVAALPFSSGTTGLPKGVMLTHTNILSNLLQLHNSDMSVSYDDVLSGILPFFHIYGQVTTLLLGLSVGATTVTMRKFDFVGFLEMIQKENITLSHLVPPIILGLSKSDLTKKYDLESLQIVTVGAAPLKIDQSLEFAQKFSKVHLLQGYGLTETSPAVTFNSPRRLKHGSAGMLLPNVKAKVVDLDSGKSLPVNTEGELYFHGPNIMKGYWRDEEATLDCLDGDWFRTGDIGYYDEEGFFHVVDRLKELIKYKGFQVAPAELEALLLAHHKILDSAVVSVPCNEAGELPRAYIVAKPGQSVSDEEIHTYMKEKASNHKQLRGGIRMIDAIPKSASGKILRRVLKDQALKDI